MDVEGTPPDLGPFVFTACTYDINGRLGSGSPDHPSTSGNQTGRLFRDGISTQCGLPKPCVIAVATGSRAYDAYAIQNQTAAAACVNVGLNVITQTACNLQVNAYYGSYNPASVCTNYAADPGLSSGIPPTFVSMSLDLGPGQTMILVVHTTNPGEIGCEYELLVDGDICQSTKLNPASWGGVKILYR